MKALCAICDSSNATTYICADCRKDPANVDWVRQPKKEVGGYNHDWSMTARDYGHKEADDTSYYDATAKQVLKLLASGLSQEVVADRVKKPLVYVKRVSAHWNKVTNGLLKRIIKGDPAV